MNGVEMMLKSLGLEPVLQAANQLAQSGLIERLAKAVDELEGIKNDIGDLREAAGLPRDGRVIDGTARLVEPDPSAGVRNAS